MDEYPRRFANSPADALQCLADLVETTRRLRLRAGADPTFRHQLFAESSTAAYVVDTAEDHGWDRMLRNNIPVYYWSKHTASLVLQASRTYPLDTNEVIELSEVEERLKSGEKVPPPTFLPKVPHGLAVFDKPVLFVEINGRQIPLSALMWMLIFWKRDKWERKEGVKLTLAIRGIEWIGTVASPCFWADAALGENFSDRTGLETDINNTFKEEQAALTKWICTASTFIDQQILSSTPTKVGKYVAKRLPVGTDPTCHVVLLRKEIRDEQNPKLESFIEWSNRWLVRGHWRQQYFPSSHSHAPIWIHPYVKGPADKPFKEPLKTVYAVRK